MNPEKREQAIQEGRNHLKFVCELYEMQIKGGRYFLHEHPWGAKSWKEPCIERLLAHPGVRVVKGNMCAYGMVAQDSQGTAPVFKTYGMGQQLAQNIEAYASSA